MSDWLGCSFSALELLCATKNRHDKLALIIMLKNICIRRKDWMTASRFRDTERRLRDRLYGLPNAEVCHGANNEKS